MRILACLGLLVLLAGCKDKANPATPVPSTAPAAPGTPAPQPAPAAATDPVDDACLVFTREIAAEMLGGEVTGPEHGKLTHIDHQRDDCTWKLGADDSKGASGTVSKHGYTCDTFVADMKKQWPTLETLDGFGTAGVVVHEAGSLLIVDVCTPDYGLMIMSGASVDKVKAAMTKMLAKLPR